MVRLLMETLGFFKKEKIYLLLFLLVVLFYVLVITSGAGFKVANPEVPAPTVFSGDAMFYDSAKLAAQIRKGMEEHPRLFSAIQWFGLFFSTMFLYGVWLDGTIVHRLWSRRELVPRDPEAPAVRWGITGIIKVTILFFAVGILLNFAIGIFHILLGRKPGVEVLLLAHAAGIDLLAVVFMMSAVKASGSRITDLFGRLKSPFQDWMLGMKGYAAILPVIVFLLIAMVTISHLISFEPEPHVLVKVFMREKTLSPWLVSFSMTLACVVGPMVEEIFFRGFFYPAVRPYIGVGWTMVLTSAIFSLVHENIFSFVPIFVLGMALCYLYEKTGSVMACAALHVTHNTTFMVYFFLIKGFMGAAG